MFRRWLSGFIKNNKEKIKNIAKIALIIALFVFFASLIFSNLKFDNKTEINNNAYNPTKTVISGNDIGQEKFEEQENIIKEFMEKCNSGNIKEAYNFLSDECKTKLYPTEKDFEDKYYKIIFSDGAKEYNLQSWVNKENYNTYRIRFTEDFMETGKYDGSVKYEDYITIVDDGNNKKININGYVRTDEINKTTTTDKIEATVISKDVYMEYETYSLKIKNLSSETILLDNLEEKNTINLIGSNNAKYKLDSINLNEIYLKINMYSTKNIKVKFLKQYGSDISDKSIKFEKVISNYNKYFENKKDYNEFAELNIKM